MAPTPLPSGLSERDGETLFLVLMLFGICAGMLAAAVVFDLMGLRRQQEEPEEDLEHMSSPLLVQRLVAKLARKTSYGTVAGSSTSPSEMSSPRSNSTSTTVATSPTICVCGGRIPDRVEGERS